MHDLNQVLLAQLSISDWCFCLSVRLDVCHQTFPIATPPTVFLWFSQNLPYMINVPVRKKNWKIFSIFVFLTFLANFFKFLIWKYRSYLGQEAFSNLPIGDSQRFLWRLFFCFCVIKVTWLQLLSWNSRFLPTPPAFDAPVMGLQVRILPLCVAWINWNDVAIWPWRNFEDTVTRFCHNARTWQIARWTDRQTPHDFKLATLMFKSLHGCAPSYLSDTCKSTPEASRHLHSSGAITCVTPWSRNHLGDRSFDVAGPRLWNKLPASLGSSDSLCQIQKTVENVLFVKD